MSLWTLSSTFQLEGTDFSYSEFPSESTEVYGPAGNKPSHLGFAFRTQPAVTATISPLFVFSEIAPCCRLRALTLLGVIQPDKAFSSQERHPPDTECSLVWKLLPTPVQMAQCSPRAGLPSVPRAPPKSWLCPPENALQEDGKELRECRESEITPHKSVLHPNLAFAHRPVQTQLDLWLLLPRTHHSCPHARILSPPHVKSSRLGAHVTMAHQGCQPGTPPHSLGLSRNARDALGRTQEAGRCLQQQRANALGTRANSRHCWHRVHEAREKWGGKTVRCVDNSQFAREKRKKFGRASFCNSIPWRQDVNSSCCWWLDPWTAAAQGEGQEQMTPGSATHTIVPTFWCGDGWIWAGWSLRDRSLERTGHL